MSKALEPVSRGHIGNVSLTFSTGSQHKNSCIDWSSDEMGEHCPILFKSIP